MRTQTTARYVRARKKPVLPGQEERVKKATRKSAVQFPASPCERCASGTNGAGLLASRQNRSPSQVSDPVAFERTTRLWMRVGLLQWRGRAGFSPDFRNKD